eukprot:1196071-Prorocentrum_minimum.AAC.12
MRSEVDPVTRCPKEQSDGLLLSLGPSGSNEPKSQAGLVVHSRTVAQSHSPRLEASHTFAAFVPS